MEAVVDNVEEQADDMVCPCAIENFWTDGRLLAGDGVEVRENFFPLKTRWIVGADRNLKKKSNMNVLSKVHPKRRPAHINLL